MTALAEQLRKVRGEIKVADLAAWSDLTEASIESWENGTRIPRFEELSMWAQVLGLRMDEISTAAQKTMPLRSLYLRATKSGCPGISELANHKGHPVLGRFLQRVSDLNEVLLPTHRVDLSCYNQLVSTPIQSIAPYGADFLAKSVRDLLGLGIGPIASIQQLVEERLGITVFWTTDEYLDSDIEGASTDSPAPSLLVNVGDEGHPRPSPRNRMVMAHELCHVLFDNRNEARFSPRFSASAGAAVHQRWEAFEDFDVTERRANAFAACFLVPAEAIKLEFSAGITASGVRDFASRSGVSWSTMAYRLEHVLGISKQEVFALRDRHRVKLAGLTEQLDTLVAPALIGGEIQSSRLLRLVLEALRDARISRTRAFELLGIRLTEQLPAHPDVVIGPTLRAPVLKQRQGTGDV